MPVHKKAQLRCIRPDQQKVLLNGSGMLQHLGGLGQRLFCLFPVPAYKGFSLSFFALFTIKQCLIVHGCGHINMVKTKSILCNL
jgi:hypothetical protein